MPLEPLTCWQRCSCWRRWDRHRSATRFIPAHLMPKDIVSSSTVNKSNDWRYTLSDQENWVLFVPTVRCFPVMPAELAWLFATRPVFLYPELLPCASLDPALYCPRRTSAFSAAEDWWAVIFRLILDVPSFSIQFIFKEKLKEAIRMGGKGNNKPQGYGTTALPLAHGKTFH